jgi:hypothetical protein
VFQGWLVGALLDVEADVGEAQALDRTAVEEMLRDDFFDVFDVDEAVPNGLRIDNNDRTVFALVETARFVGPDVVFEAGVLDGILEGGFKLFAAARKAARTVGAFVAFVGANEDVVVKFRQEWDSLSQGLDGCTTHRAF